MRNDEVISAIFTEVNPSIRLSVMLKVAMCSSKRECIIFHIGPLCISGSAPIYPLQRCFISTVDVVCVCSSVPCLCLSVCACLYLFVCASLCLFVCTCLYLFVCARLCLFACARLCLFVCACLCIKNIPRVYFGS
uniref:Uncharacterized protein n=1 Tax=Ascaris lumbricoides TaxID=6252 RepID=A0A9J2PQN5_ASCLU